MVVVVGCYGWWPPRLAVVGLLLLLLLLLVCFHRYRVVVVVGFSLFENKAGPTDGRTDRQPDAHTD